MNRQGRVLVVDDIERWREQLVETLQSDDFYADSASTADEVLQRLDEAFYHLLLLDVRLVDSDPSNRDGMDLLGELKKRGLSEGLKVIVLTAYGNQERVREAFKDHKVADFLSKDHLNRQTFLKSVHQVFAKELDVNLALDIHWQQVTGPEQVVLNLRINGERVKRDSSLQSSIAVELEDLLCRLFHDASSVLLRPLTAGQQSPTGVLWVQPFYETGGARPVIVKFGDFRKIEQEYSNFKQYVQPFIGGGRNATALDLKRTPRLGGIIYSLIGADNDNLEDFGSYYRHADISALKDVLDHLFLHTCRAWYANLSQLRPYNLTKDYQEMLEFTPEKLARSLAELHKSVVQVKQRLSFKSLKTERTFTNPLAGMAGPPLVLSTYTCITHGDFNQHNLLVDTSRRTWLIDFQSIGRGHLLRDFAQLDSEIRFFLLSSEEATLEERLQMEEALCSIERFSHVQALACDFPTENHALAKTYATVVHLRTLAQNLVAQNPGDDISEYYAALFYNAMNTLRFYSLPSRQREHALLCASLLADRLGLKG